MANSQKNLRTRRAVPLGSSTQRHAALEYQPPKLFKVFRNFFVLGIVVVMTAVGYTLYWFVIATNLKDAVTNWIVARAQQGITASYSQIEIGGFPSNFRVVLTDPKLHTANFAAAGQSEQGAEKWFWQGQRVVAEMKPWNFKKFSVDLSGVHNLAYKNQNRDYQFSGEVQKMVIAANIFSDGWPRLMQLEIGDLSMSESRSRAKVTASSATVASRRLLPGKEQINSPAKTPTFTLKIKFQGLHLPQFLNLPLGYDIEELSSELKVIGKFTLSRSVVNLARWRDAGGIIEIDTIQGTYGALKIHAAGTVALDKDLQPLIAMSAKLQGFFPAINAFKKAGYIRSGDAAIAKLVLGVLSKRDPKGGRSISLPLTLQDGQLFAGPVPLMAVPAIDWGEDPPSLESIRKLDN